MKDRKSTKKYGLEVRQVDPLNQTHMDEIKEQLRRTIEQLEHYKLTAELETQKRAIA